MDMSVPVSGAIQLDERQYVIGVGMMVAWLITSAAITIILIAVCYVLVQVNTVYIFRH